MSVAIIAPPGAGSASRAKSALISPAACSSSGRWWSSSVLDGGLGGVGVDVQRGDHRRSPSRSGAATDRMPRVSCSSVSAQPRARTSRSSASRSARSGCQRGVQPRAGRLGQHRVDLLGGQRGQQHLAQRGLQGREPGADLHGQRHDLGHGDPGDVDDVGAVELGDRAGLAGPRGQPLQVRAGHLPQPHRADVGHAQLEHPRGEREAGAVGAHVAQLLQGEQDPPGGRAGQPGRGGHLGQRHGLRPGANAVITSSPRASASMKSGPVPARGMGPPSHGPREPLSRPATAAPECRTFNRLTAQRTVVRDCGLTGRPGATCQGGTRWPIRIRDRRWCCAAARC